MSRLLITTDTDNDAYNFAKHLKANTCATG